MESGNFNLVFHKLFISIVDNVSININIHILLFILVMTSNDFMMHKKTEI